jgi:O-antigen/teichoic acid export membrane protein
MLKIFYRYTYVLKRIIQFSPHDTSNESGKSNERYRRIILTGGGAMVAKIITMATSLITVPMTLHYLGDERFGLWMTISSIITFMSFADLGLGNGLLNAVSEANGNDNIQEAKIAITSTLIMLIGIAIILLLSFIVIYPFIPWSRVFNVSSKTAVAEAGPAVMVFFMIFIINMPLGIIRRIQAGYQEGYIFQFWSTIGAIFGLLGILYCIFLELGLPWLIFAFTGGPLVATVINWIIFFTFSHKSLLPSIEFFQLSVAKKLINSGLIFFILTLFTLIGNSSDNIIIAQTLGPSSVAGYAIVQKLFLFTMITQFFIAPLWPAFGEALSRGDISWAKRTLKKGLKLSIGSSVILALPILIFGKQILTLWVGAEFIPSWSLLIGFYLFSIFSNYGGMISTFLNNGPLVGKQTIMIGLASTTAVLLKIYLSSVIGLSGIIWATLIGYGIFYIVPSYRLAFNHLKRI